MTEAEFIEVTADHEAMVALQGYRDAIADDSHPSVRAMQSQLLTNPTLATAIKVAWLAETDNALASAQGDFNVFTGTSV